jgi:hypothetical protein
VWHLHTVPAPAQPPTALVAARQQYLPQRQCCCVPPPPPAPVTYCPTGSAAASPVRLMRAPSSSSTRPSLSEHRQAPAPSAWRSPGSLAYSSRMVGLSFMSLYSVPMTATSRSSPTARILTTGCVGVWVSKWVRVCGGQQRGGQQHGMRWSGARQDRGNRKCVMALPAAVPCGGRTPIVLEHPTSVVLTTPAAAEGGERGSSNQGLPVVRLAWLLMLPDAAADASPAAATSCGFGWATRPTHMARLAICAPPAF